MHYEVSTTLGLIQRQRIPGQRCVTGRGTCGKYSIGQLNRPTEKKVYKEKESVPYLRKPKESCTCN